jgi:predicted O-methyltransferase YrrM
MNKETFIAVDKYYENLFLSNGPDFEQINRAAEEAGLPSIQVSPLQGKFLQLIVQALGANRVLEIGTLGGYSTAWLANGLPDTGLLISLEIDNHHAKVAKHNLEKFDFRPEIKILVGDGLQLIDELIESDTEPFDLIFIDADKEQYTEYLDRSLHLARPGTFIIADNVVRGGRITDQDSKDSSVNGIRRFNQRLTDDPKLSATVLQTVGAKSYDGFTFIVVNPE